MMRTMLRRPFTLLPRWQALGLGVLLLFAVLGCDLYEEAAADVKEAYGVDINDPSQVAGAAVGGRTMGDETKADGLDVVRGIRRAHHEQKGDALYDKRDYWGALQEYKEALKWNEPPPPKKEEGLIGTLVGAVGSVASRGDPEKTANLEYNIALSYENLRDWQEAPKHFRRAARSYADAAQAATTRERAKHYWIMEAQSYYSARDWEKACTLGKKAGTDAYCP